MLVIIIVALVATLVGFAAGVRSTGCRLAVPYYRLRNAVRNARRVHRGHCDVCMAKDVLVVDATMLDGSGGCCFHWSVKACQREQERRAEARAENSDGDWHRLTVAEERRHNADSCAECSRLGEPCDEQLLAWGYVPVRDPDGSVHWRETDDIPF